MCDDCRKSTVDCHSGTVVVELSLWGAPNIWLDTEPEGAALPSVLLQPRDALAVARSLVVAAVRLWWLNRRMHALIRKASAEARADDPARLGGTTDGGA